MRITYYAQWSHTLSLTAAALSQPELHSTGLHQQTQHRNCEFRNTHKLRMACLVYALCIRVLWFFRDFLVFQNSKKFDNNESMVMEQSTLAKR